MNELEFDDDWSDRMFDKLLANILQRSAYRGRMAVVKCDSLIGHMIQRKAHCDLVMQVLGGSIAVDWKFVRFPRNRKDGSPGNWHWRDIFFEEMSCTIPGQEAQGWGISSIADILLWCQASLDEDSANCWPFPLRRLRAWIVKNRRGLAQRRVKNIINGRALWTEGLLAPIGDICRDLQVEGFRIDLGDLVGDLWGNPELQFFPGGRCEVVRRGPRKAKEANP
jgi:hypothetical protein